ncbi:MAG: leucine-rich repeat domain-containing protein [Clostridia bacterium]|nr:leucine-rich repeat domain-containing protein [Clostridia bacterium]MDE7329113.1 leucine-rich repeat domain-containing protein [Clostridia bacterium]
MVLNFKYHSDSGILQSYQEYTVAQGSNLTNSIAITSTDINAKNYKYCLEFVCYNSRNVPKTQFVSPLLEYTKEGVSFVLPANLLQYAGHVDMQLVGYSLEDNSVIFKSVNKGCKAFNVEGSLNVIESESSNTPNLLTELLDEIKQYRIVRDDFVVSLKKQATEAIDEILQAGNVFYKVIFRINGEVIKSMCVKEGAILTEPEFTLPAGCEVKEGWYDMSKDKLWDFINDHVYEDVTLTLNFASIGIGIAANGRIKNFANLTGDIYLPDYNNGARITAVDTTVTNLSDGVNLHFGYFMSNYAGVLKNNDKVTQMYFPQDSKFRNRDNAVYSDKEQMGLIALVFTPRTKTATFNVPSDCQQLASYAFSNNPNLKKVTIPNTVTSFNSFCIYNTGLTTLTVPASVNYFAPTPVYNNKELEKVYLEGDFSSLINESTFIDMTNLPTLKRPTLYVRPEHYAAYVARGLSYDIEVIGKDYLDEHFVAS